MVEETNYNKARELADKFITILLDSEYSLSIKITSLVQLYNNVSSDSGLKSLAFERLVQLCMDNNCTDIIIERARQVIETSKDWNLTDEERRSLYKRVANILDKLDDTSYAFKIMHAYVKLFKDGDKAGIESAQNEARRCIILAIKAVDVINFAELVDLPAIKDLQQKNQELIKLLNLLTQGSAKEFAG